MRFTEDAGCLWCDAPLDRHPQLGVCPDVDAEGVVIDDSCNCDLDSPCNNPQCVMERDLEERAMFASYRAGRLDPPVGVQRAMYVDAMIDSGRDYLLRDDERP